MKTLSKAIFLFAIAAFLPILSFSQQLVEQDFYENGKVKTSVFRDGEVFYILNFYESGSMKEKVIYSSNKRCGKFQSWYENGQLHTSVEYANNIPTGIWNIWNEEGKILATAEFDRGKLSSGSMWDEYGNLLAQR